VSPQRDCAVCGEDSGSVKKGPELNSVLPKLVLLVTPILEQGPTLSILFYDDAYSDALRLSSPAFIVL